jgi:hypothetical protein
LPFERSTRRPAIAGAPGCGATLERLDVPEAERLERREVEAADRARDVPERVRALVAELRRVGQLARPDCVEHDDTRPGHDPKLS